MTAEQFRQKELSVIEHFQNAASDGCVCDVCNAVRDYAAARLVEKEREMPAERVCNFAEHLDAVLLQRKLVAAEQRLQEAQADRQHWQIRYQTDHNLIQSLQDELVDLRERLRQREAELEQAQGRIEYLENVKVRVGRGERSTS